MRFAEPWWLLVGLFAVGLVLLLRVRGEALTSRALRTLAGARLVHAGALPSRLRRWLRVAVVAFAVAMGFIALARPQRGLRWQTLDRKGTDLLLVVDTSKSMNADDVRPTRLERAKLSIRDLVERFPGDRIGLVAFAGDAFVESPMTLDHDALLETLGAFDTSIIARGGTDVGQAIDVGAAALEADSADQKIMVLVTDGEDLESNGVEAAKRAGETGITIETVGVGTPAGELVPAKNDQGVTVGLVRDDTGAPVRSRLDEPGLRAIAQAAHGTYRPLGADGRGLERLYDEALAPLSHTEHDARVRRVYAEWFGVPLALSIFGIVFDALLGWRPRARRRARRATIGSTSVRAVATAAVALTLLLPASVQASPQDAEKAYGAGRFDDAAREYEAELARHPKDARLAIDAGNASYRAGHYDAAEASYGKALTAADPKLQQQVLYDLGDARYRLGAATLADAPEKTKERWKASIAAYEGALSLTPGDADAHFNRDFVKQKLAELESKQPKPPPQQDPSKEGDQGQDAKKDGAKNDGSPKDGSKNDGSPKDGSKNDGSPKDGAAKKSGPEAAKNGSPDGTQPNQPKPGAQSPAQRGPGNGDTSGETGAAQGQLSPKDARALLDSLRGDERHPVTAGPSDTPDPADSARKDW